ncbi:VRR-NUC domain-containing protein [Serinibacter salmoneus]|uniref:VRR-NUC domain-containing protein n=1 Tax=Serinibacter salmoneus TaxID=556530 RepID=A0A2A9CZN7_9MICO|nr:VRR-NUC domain-containing protein [Serinibacter salmoneus]PFG19853.1 VRR-NUC domain-containing protein [Serinibacter salmoneus]
MLTTAEHNANVAAAMSEDALQTQVLRIAAVLGWRAYHTHDSRRSQKGFPDLTLVHRASGRLVFRELKSAKGRLRPEQRDWLDDLRAAGVDAGVWRPADLVGGVIERELRGGGGP